MATVVLDRSLAERLREERAATGADRWDEVWEGTYMMTPLPNIEHQEFVSRLVAIIQDTLGWSGPDIVLPGTNVSDRIVGWQHNYRCPDVAVFLAGTSARNCNTHWCGGPDFAVEIVSDDDQTREKIEFYGKVGTRELLIVDRDPWRLELLRLDGSELKSVGIATESAATRLTSVVLPLTFQLVAGEDRPILNVTRSTDGKLWDV